jgi:hypothetical protein
MRVKPAEALLLQLIGERTGNQVFGQGGKTPMQAFLDRPRLADRVSANIRQVAFGFKLGPQMSGTWWFAFL